jgi:hypothetical protein
MALATQAMAPPFEMGLWMALDGILLVMQDGISLPSMSGARPPSLEALPSAAAMQEQQHVFRYLGMGKAQDNLTIHECAELLANHKTQRCVR